VTRKRIIAGNWKMNTDASGAQELTGALLKAGAGEASEGADLVLIPPTCFLPLVLEAAAGSSLKVGAQNLHPAERGAYTGEVSGPMLVSLGVDYVLCGHSERRHLFGESSALVGEKVRAAHSHSITPILCVGETLEEREQGRTDAVVLSQLDQGLRDLSPERARATIVAYEPVWAIGTGLTATPEQAQAVHRAIRHRIESSFGEDTAAAIRIQYGGSVKPSNAAELLGQEDIDGALVGGASLQAESFLAIARA